ncbi:MAG: oxygen-insensitive NADPH nitroreductase [Leucothrix sp.]
MNAILDAQLNHRSIRKFTDKAIPETLLLTLIQAAQGAASSSFIQAYSLVQVANTESRSKIATLAGGQTWVEKATEFLVICADLSRIEHCCVQEGMGPLEGNAEHFLAASVDAALMAQNLMLGAESVGLGAVFIGGIRNDPAQVSELLNLPDQVYPIFGLCLGWPDAEPDLKPRLPVDVILHKETYDASRCDNDVALYDEQMQAYYASRGSNQRVSNWSAQTAVAVQQKKREHLLSFLQSKGFLKV